jgi:hypothetical protein
MPRRSPNALTTPSGRPAAFGTRVRERIDTTKVVKRLQRCALGDEEMTQTELTAARILLDRTVPVLKAIESAPEGDRSAKTITNTELFRVIEGSAERVK